MASIKTAISIDRSLFYEADALARELSMSRSGLFKAALEEFIRKRRNRNLLERLNKAYEEEPDRAEGERLRGMRKHHRRIAEGGW